MYSKRNLLSLLLILSATLALLTGAIGTAAAAGEPGGLQWGTPVLAAADLSASAVDYTAVEAASPAEGGDYAISNDGFELIQFTEYTAYDGDWAARGVVKNNSGDWAFFTRVYADLIDAAGNLMDTEYTFVNGVTGKTRYGTLTDTAVGPGEMVTFDMRLSSINRDAVARVENVRVDFDRATTRGDLKAQLTLESLDPYKDYWGDWDARGTVKNHGGPTAYFVEVRADLFDAGGSYLGGAYTFVDGHNHTTKYGTETDTALGAGQSGTVDRFLCTIPFSQVAEVKTIINWME